MKRKKKRQPPPDNVTRVGPTFDVGQRRFRVARALGPIKSHTVAIMGGVFVGIVIGEVVAGEALLLVMGNTRGARQSAWRWKKR